MKTPSFSPMLAKIGNQQDLSRKNFIYEPKLDGVRALCYIHKKTKLINRRGRDISFKYPEFNFAKKINAKNCILDGEIVAYDENGIPNFHLLQTRDRLGKKNLIEERSKEFPATYVVFDILMKNGKKLTNLPLTERKKILKETIPKKSLSFHLDQTPFTKNGKKLWKETKKLKLEGVMAKASDSKYLPGIRTANWLKIKNVHTVDCIIVGYTQKTRLISSLLLAVYDKGKLRYIGKVGTGFTDQFLKELYDILKSLQVKKPTLEIPRTTAKIYWTKPITVCEIEYLELTKAGRLRVPSFLRLRDDKRAKECTWKDQF